MSEAQPLQTTPQARRWLEDRNLLTADDRLAIPLFREWIRNYAPIHEPK